MIKTLTLLGAAALAASALATPAAADTDEMSVVVSYAGLNLAKPADAALLDRRIKAAAQEICGEPAILDLSLTAANMKACQANAVARAKADLRLAMGAGGGRTLAVRTN
jgi:UrcA family protein